MAKPSEPNVSDVESEHVNSVCFFKTFSIHLDIMFLKC